MRQQDKGRALLAGMVLGNLLKDQANPDSPFTILGVHPMVDSDGNWLPRVEVTMPSGTYTIAVIDNDVIEEEM